MDPNVTKQIQKLQTFNNPCDLLWRLLWFNLVGGSAPLSHSLPSQWDGGENNKKK